MRYKTKEGLKADLKVFQDYIWDPSKKEFVELKRLKKVTVPLYRVELIDGDRMLLPAPLGVKTESGRRVVSTLKKGDKVIKEDGQLVIISEIKRECGSSVKCCIPDMPNFVCETLWCLGVGR